MSVTIQVLGDPGRDNAALARVNTGKGIYRLLFDCGDACLTTLARSEIQQITRLCFSHLHMDHIGGFDSFFRTNFDCDPAEPIHIWGPPETARIVQHRMQGFMWNLVEGRQGIWFVHDILPDAIHSWRFMAEEAFAVAHDAGSVPFQGLVIDDPAFTLRALPMDHLTPSLAYILTEAPHVNVDTDRIAALGLAPGAWLRELKFRPPTDPDQTMLIDGSPYRLGDLRRDLLVESPGEKVAYLTDFLLDDAAMAQLVPALAGCQTIICECQYRDEDAEYARRHHHMMPMQAAELARRASAQELILFHLSERYRPPEWQAMLAAARTIFPSTHFPEHWVL